LALSAAALAQDRPTKACGFDGFSAEGKLAEVATATVGYYGCESARNCAPTRLAAGEVVTPYHTDGDWICAYLQQRDGAGPGWVRARDIREIAADFAPPLDGWTGTWANGNGRVQITLSQGAGKLHLAGEAEWHGAHGVVHTGDFEGDAAPAGNHLHFVEDDAGSCTVDLTLIGRYLLANDNGRCGGLNVRFWGIWKRAAK
jgi:hypothetical protein